jgi:hypothetical protein
MQDTITINGVDYQRTGTIKVNDDYRNVCEAIKFDLDRLIADAKEIQADYAQQGLTHNSLENEGYLRGLLTIKGNLDYHVKSYQLEETSEHVGACCEDKQTVSEVMFEQLGYAILKSPDGFYLIGELDNNLTHQTTEPPFVWIYGNYDYFQEAFAKLQNL